MPKKQWRTEHLSFQRKYTAFLLAAIFGAVALFLAVASYQMHSNYVIFRQLAFDTSPELVSHMEREMTEFGLMVVATLVAVFAFCLVIGMRMTANIVRPLIHLERHMKKVTNGDWASPDFRFRDDEELAGLLDTYSYMYRSLRAHTEMEIKMLEKLSIDPQNREAMMIWKSLVAQKRSQLNLPTRFTGISDSVEETLPSHGTRRAS